MATGGLCGGRPVLVGKERTVETVQRLRLASANSSRSRAAEAAVERTRARVSAELRHRGVPNLFSWPVWLKSIFEGWDLRYTRQACVPPHPVLGWCKGGAGVG